MGLSALAPTLAIPSPDLVLGLFASAAQVVGLATATFLGVASRRRFGASSSDDAGQAASASRWPFRICLGLLVVSVATLVLYYGHQQDVRSESLRRNLLRPSLEAGKRVGDVSLKTLSFSDQTRHSGAIDTEQLSRWVAAGTTDADRRVEILDVRETEEVERGVIPGASAVRYPDLLASPDRLDPTSTTVLLCYSGNRSSELVDALTAAGYGDLHFVIGGYEKWVAEGRDLEVPAGISRRELRDIADYPEKETLLDTAAATELIEIDGGLVIDVRYPEDCERWPFPGAINLPVRKMTSAELDEAIAQLPCDRPILIPCYDKRSSFYASILGLRLYRAGLDYRGRYTLPHEYFVKGRERDHVVAWNSSHQGRSLLDVAAASMAPILSVPRNWLGGLAVAILFVVLSLRVVLFPLSAKNDRDQAVSRLRKPRIDELKQVLKDDPAGYAREYARWSRDNGLTPLRNVVATLAQITLFVVFFVVVKNAAVGSEESFLWVPALGAPDPTRILPVVIGVLVVAHVLLGGARTVGRWLGAVSFGVAIAGLTWNLVAAVDLYLVANLFLLLIQGAAIRRVVTRKLTAHRSSPPSSPRPLRDGRVVGLAKAHRYLGTGGKAERLGRLIEAGFPVPGGFVLTDEMLFSTDDAPELSAGDMEIIHEQWKRLRSDRVAVRSSGLNEDGAENSYAGVFESILDVRRDHLKEAILGVWSSLRSSRARAYSGEVEERGAIVVQGMVNAEYAGVVFTEHPEQAGSILIEMIRGLGEQLVSGQATPTTHRFGRITGRCLDDISAPIDLAPLIELSRKVEATFGVPQDIEWAYADGRFWLLQARDITVLLRNQQGERALFERERHRILAEVKDSDPDDVVFAQNELAALLPRPTPMSLGLMRDLWDAGGAADLACRHLGIPYDVHRDSTPFISSLFGSLYVNRAEEKRRSGKSVGGIASFRLTRMLDGIAGDFRLEFLPTFRRQARRRAALDLSRLELDELGQLFEEGRRRFAKASYLRAELVNLAAEFAMNTAKSVLDRSGFDAAKYLGQVPDTVVHLAMERLQCADADRGIAEFLALFGHRAPHDFEISEPRYGEDLSRVRRMAAAAAKNAQAPRDPIEPTGHRMVDLAVERARRFQALKEEAKHEVLRDFAHLRSLLLEIGRRLNIGDAIFGFAPHELAGFVAATSREEMIRVSEQRMLELAALDEVIPKSSFTLADLERYDPYHSAEPVESEDGVVCGLRIAGPGEVSGRVRVLRDSDEMDAFQDGEILVCRFTDPTWTPLFARARGIVTEVGGWLSHAAIQAREYGLTGIVGAEGAMARLRTGDLVSLGVDGTVRERADRRRYVRRPCSGMVEIKLGERTIVARLVDVSRKGIQLRTEQDGVVLGEPLVIDIDSDRFQAQSWSAQVVRLASDTHFGLEFADEQSDADGSLWISPRTS